MGAGASWELFLAAFSSEIQWESHQSAAFLVAGGMGERKLPDRLTFLIPFRYPLLPLTLVSTLLGPQPSLPCHHPVSSLRGCTQEACPRPACGWFLLHTPHPQEKLASPVSHPVLDELQAKGQVHVAFTRGRVRDLLTLGTNKRFSQATTLLKWAFLFQYRFQTGLQDE